VGSQSEILFIVFPSGADVAAANVLSNIIGNMAQGKRSKRAPGVRQFGDCARNSRKLATAKHRNRPLMKPANGPDWDANAHYQNDKVAKEYDAVRFSGAAGQVFNDLERRTIVRAFAGVTVGSRIADVPCGTGRLAEPLLAAGYKVHGMDISPQMLSVAAGRLSRFGNAFTTEVADAKAMTRGHDQYDAVLCARVLMHFELDEQIEFLRGVTQITRGPIVITHSFSSPYQRFRRSIKRTLGHQPPARHPVTASEIDRLLEACQLKEARHLRLNALVSEAIYIVAVPRD